MYKKLTLYVCLLFIFGNIHAQELYFKRNGMDLGERYEKMKNNPYLFEKWVVADLYNKLGQVKKDALLNYNCYTRELEIHHEGKILALDEFSHPQFKVKSTKSIYAFRPTVASGFVKVEYEGEKCSLYVQHISKLNDKGSSFLREMKSFITKDGKSKEITANLLDTISDEKVKNYALTNNLDPDKNEDMVKLLQFIEKANNP